MRGRGNEASGSVQRWAIDQRSRTLSKQRAEGLRRLPIRQWFEKVCVGWEEGRPWGLFFCFGVHGRQENDGRGAPRPSSLPLGDSPTKQCKITLISKPMRKTKGRTRDFPRAHKFVPSSRKHAKTCRCSHSFPMSQSTFAVVPRGNSKIIILPLQETKTPPFEIYVAPERAPTRPVVLRPVDGFLMPHPSRVWWSRDNENT